MSAWNAANDLQLMKPDEEVGKLREWLEKANSEESQKIREEELDCERQLFEQGRGK